MRSGLFPFLLALVVSPVIASDGALPVTPVNYVAPVVAKLPPPESLRPCCAFGYNLKVRALGVPIPAYQIGNILTLATLGDHRYNDSALGAVTNLIGLSAEKNGLIYTHHGGFIDIAHVRDTADNTFYLFSQIYPRLGQQWRLFYSEELGLRRIQLNPFQAPTDPRQRYRLAAWLAGNLAFQLAQWHEVAQWYGFQSVPGFSEEISAFSPEDLYSNLLGARLAVNVLLAGQGGSTDSYNRAMTQAIHRALIHLSAVPEGETEKWFREVDGDWWNSNRRVPDKFLVLKRNYSLSAQRLPTPVPFEKMPPYDLDLPQTLDGYSLNALGELQIHPGHSMQALPVPDGYYTPGQFQALADKAQQTDRNLLHRLKE